MLWRENYFVGLSRNFFVALLRLIIHNYLMVRTFSNIVFLISIFSLGLLNPTVGSAYVTAPNLPSAGVLSQDKNGFLDKNVDYSQFSGRVSDRNKMGNILKVKVENDNIKFFRSGDKVLFRVGENGTNYCQASVKDVESFYFTLYVATLSPCTKRGFYLRRGSVLRFTSEVLRERVFQGSKYREILLLRKEDYLRQLSQVNHFIWSYDQQRVQLAAEYDLRVLDVQKSKQRAMDDLQIQNQEQTLLQLSLQRKLDEMDDTLKRYTIERQELMVDRWHLDHDLGLPVGKRPQEMKRRASSK